MMDRQHLYYIGVLDSKRAARCWFLIRLEDFCIGQLQDRIMAVVLPKDMTVWRLEISVGKIMGCRDTHFVATANLNNHSMLC